MRHPPIARAAADRDRTSTQENFDEKAATWDDDPVRVERAAEIARLIMDRVPLTSLMNVLDFGSGTGLLGFNFLPHVASVTFADPSEGMLARVEGKLRSVHPGHGEVHRVDPDALALPRSYDVIVSLLTLHHVSDPAAVIAFLARHLHPGGWLALCDLDTEDGTFHDDPSADVHHGFDRAELAALAESAGLGGIHFTTAFTIRAEHGDSVREYPLFLLTGRRRAG